MRKLFLATLLVPLIAYASYVSTPSSSGGGTWGSITGTLSSQSDLNTALGLKATSASPTFTGTATMPSGSVTSSAWDTGTSKMTAGKGVYSGTWGSIAPVTDTSDNGCFAVSETAGHPPALISRMFAGGGDGPIIDFQKSGGTSASPTALPNSSFMGQLSWMGAASSSAFAYGFDIYCNSSGAWSVSNHGVDCYIESTANGSASVASRLHFDDTGNTKIENGNLIVTKALVTSTSSVSLTADDQAVTTTNKSLILLTSDDATSTNRTFTLGAGASGQHLTLIWNDAVNAGELADSGIAKIAGTWTPGVTDTLSLVFDGTNWDEVSRSNN